MLAYTQFIDSSTDGGGAFLVFAIMCFVIVGILFAVDKVRRRAEEQAEADAAAETASEEAVKEPSPN